MKIVRFSQNGHAPRLGCYVHQDEVMDLAASCGAFLTAHGVVRATALADALFPQSTRGFLEGGVATQEMLAKMLAGLTVGTFEPVTAPASEVRFHAPSHDPGKFICIGLNYTDHAAETGNPAPPEPLSSPSGTQPFWILTNPFAGVGFSRKPPVVLQPGDTVRLEITGLGVLENSVKDA
jgi:2-keto-4-pentenoate hydratase/2-oxohepta-3-ene-1,7-dioic acid hydratase in catechol pathway